MFRGSSFVLPCLVAMATPLTGVAQMACDDGTSPVELSMLLEKTIFNVDVLTLEVSLGGLEADPLRAIEPTDDPSDEEEDVAARQAADVVCADSELTFLRNVSLDQLLDAIAKSSRAARDDGLMEPATYEMIDRSLPAWYAFLDGRGVREGDRMTYRIRGDTLGIRYRSVEGEVLLDQTEIDAARSRSVLAGYFARGSEFRDGLIESLFRGRSGLPTR